MSVQPLDRIITVDGVRVDALSREDVRALLAGGSHVMSPGPNMVQVHVMRRVGDTSIGGGAGGRAEVMSLEEFSRAPLMSVLAVLSSG